MPKLTPDITGAGDMLICGQFCLACNGSEMSIHTNALPRKDRGGKQKIGKLGRESNTFVIDDHIASSARQ